MQAHTLIYPQQTHTRGYLSRSIDPAWLLSAGYVSFAAALPVRGRMRAAEGVKEEKYMEGGTNEEAGGVAERRVEVRMQR